MTGLNSGLQPALPQRPADSFVPGIAADAAEPRRPVITDIDPAAGAAAVPTITRDGTAMPGTHGNFPSPSAVTHLGSCIAEAQ